MNDDEAIGRKTVRRSLLLGFGVSLALTVIVTSMELIENPGGVFWQDGELHWSNTLETAWSWFFPTFWSVSVIAFLVLGGFAFIRQRRTQKL